MPKSSIHIRPVKSSSESHNLRKKELDYVKDFGKENEHWIDASIREKKQEIKVLYEQNVGQRMQKKTTPIREGVVNLSKTHTLADVQQMAKRIEEVLGVKAFQIHIHRDEGRDARHINFHAHVLFDWQNKATGRMYSLKSQDMVKMQDIVASSLSLERGKSSSIKHLNSVQYKAEALSNTLEITSRRLIEAEKEVNAIKGAMVPLKWLKTAEKAAKLIAPQSVKKSLDLIFSLDSPPIQRLKSDLELATKRAQMEQQEYQERILSLKSGEESLSRAERNLQENKSRFERKLAELKDLKTEVEQKRSEMLLLKSEVNKVVNHPIFKEFAQSDAIKKIPEVEEIVKNQHQKDNDYGLSL